MEEALVCFIFSNNSPTLLLCRSFLNDALSDSLYLLEIHFLLQSIDILQIKVDIVATFNILLTEEIKHNGIRPSKRPKTFPINCL